MILVLIFFAFVSVLLVGCSNPKVSQSQLRAELTKRMTMNLGNVTSKQIRVSVPILSPAKGHPGRYQFSAVFDYQVPTYRLVAYPPDGGRGKYVVSEKTPPNTTVHASGIASVEGSTGQLIAIRYTGGGFGDVGVLMSQIKKRATKVVVLSQRIYRDLVTPESPAVRHFRADVSDIPNLSLKGRL